MSTALVTIANNLADRFGMGHAGGEVIDVLKATAFKGPATDAQLTALLIVANQHGLNPFTKEIYAFPDSRNGIVPVVGVDGWSRIINSHAQFDGMEFQQDDESCTCIIFRKDRSHAIKVTEWMAECARKGVAPWQSHPRRMLRHKAMIQCARLAFGFGGIVDPDEAEGIIEGQATLVPQQRAAIEQQPPALPTLSDAEFDAKFPPWRDLIRTGRKSPAEILKTVSTKAVLTEQQIARIETVEVDPPADDTQGDDA